jgi:DNA-binding helix-hairpin-helix protein with protein kinase domain
MHQAGHVVGDVNHGNLLIGQEGTAMFIDCDSFQITGKGGVYTCDVGVALFTAPELQNKVFRGLVRTANHDLFGLAVLLFHLIFMGRHPFAGRYLGPGDMPIEKAIAEHRFAYGPDRTLHMMERPPGALALDMMGPDIASLFIRAFGRGSDISPRPDGVAWAAALDKLKDGLRPCPHQSSHQYPGHLAGCPWCDLETATGRLLFGARPVAGATGAVSVAALWQAVERVRSPGPGPFPQGVEAATYKYRLNSDARDIFFARLLVALACGVTFFVQLGSRDPTALFIVLAFVCGRLAFPNLGLAFGDKKSIEKKYVTALDDWNRLADLWRKECDISMFDGKLDELELVRRMLAELDIEHRARLARIDSDSLEKQRSAWLRSFIIRDGAIPSLTFDDVMFLAKIGIHTAEDADKGRLSSIPGLSVRLAEALGTWRTRLERNYRPDFGRITGAASRVEYERDMASRRSALVVRLRAGAAELKLLRDTIRARRAWLMPQLRKVGQNLSDIENRRNQLV